MGAVKGIDRRYENFIVNFLLNIKENTIIKSRSHTLSMWLR